MNVIARWTVIKHISSLRLVVIWSVEPPSHLLFAFTVSFQGRKEPRLRSSSHRTSNRSISFLFLYLTRSSFHMRFFSYQVFRFSVVKD